MEDKKQLTIEGFTHYKIDKKGNLYNDKDYQMSMKITDSGVYYALKSNIQPYPKSSFHMIYLLAETFIPNEGNKEYVHYDGNLANIDINKLKWIDVPHGKRPMKKQLKLKEPEIVEPLEPKKELTAEEKREKKRIEMKKYRYKKRYGNELVL
jgi:hypothetical protein